MRQIVADALSDVIATGQTGNRWVKIPPAPQRGKKDEPSTER